MEEEITKNADASNSPQQSTDTNNIQKEKVTKVGKNTPDEDFLALMDAYEFGQGEQDLEYFADIGKQLETVIEQLVFQSEVDETDKIIDAIVRYRLESIFYAPWQYNEWMERLKESILKSKKNDLWEDIVRWELGIINMLESDIEKEVTEEQSTDFYKI